MAGDTAPPPTIEEIADGPQLLDTASRGRLIGILVMLALLSEVVPFQYSMGGVVTELVGRSFPSSGNGITWMITIIGVVGAGTMALVTRMADLWGRKRMLLACSGLFLVGSVICAVTTSWPVFLVGRGLEAVALGMSALGYTLIRDIMPRSWIPVSVGVIGTGLGVSALFGPLISGLLTDHYSWRSIFWFLTVYMAITIPLFLLIVPESPRRDRQRLDIPGAVLLGLGLAGVLVYLSEGQDWGWGKPSCYAYLIGGLVALALFVVCEARASSPIMDLALLREPRLLMIMLMSIFATTVIALVTFAASFMFLTSEKVVKASIIAAASQRAHLPAPVVAKFITFHGDLSYAHGYTPMQLALRILLWNSVTAMIVGPLGGLWVRSRGPRPALMSSAILLLIASVGLSYWHNSWQSQAVYGVVFGVAFGLFYASLPNLLMETVTPAQQATSAGVMAVFGAIGAAFATALATTVLVHHPFQVIAMTPTGQKLVTNIPQVYTNGGYGQAYLLVAGGGSVVAILLAAVIWFLRPRAVPAAE